MPGSGHALRRVLSVALIAVGVVLAPVAVVGAWAKAQLVDTDRFVQTFAPLAEAPEVQGFVADRVVSAIDEQIGIDGLLGSGVRRVLEETVDGIVTSPQFAQLFDELLRQSHEQAVGLLQGDPDTLLQLGSDGTISISVANLTRELKQVLADRGVPAASLIPEIDRPIPIVSIEALPRVQVIYGLAVGFGAWLPWAALGALVLGVALAVRRARALMWTGLSLAAILGATLAAFAVGRSWFIVSMSPDTMPVDTAQVLFDQLTGAMRSTCLWLLVPSALLAVGGWIAGTGRAAVSFRATVRRVFARGRGRPGGTALR